VEFAVVGERRLAPGALDDVDGLSMRSRLSWLRRPWRRIRIRCRPCPCRRPTSDAPLAEIVEQRQLHGEPHGMMEGHLHDGKADADRSVFMASAAANISESE